MAREVIGLVFFIGMANGLSKDFRDLHIRVFDAYGCHEFLSGHVQLRSMEEHEMKDYKMLFLGT